MAMTVKIDGLEAFKKMLEGKAKKSPTHFKTILDRNGLKIVNAAKRKAPVNEGALRNSISHKPEGTNIEIVVNAKYAAFIEFGTKKYAAKYVATLPQNWQEYAATFKGKKEGNIDDFLKAIFEWVKAKGIGGKTTKSGRTSKSKDSVAQMEATAYIIALRILQNGIKAQPYLYPAINEVTPMLEADINRFLQDERY